MTTKDIQPQLTDTAIKILEKRYFLKDETGKPIENASQMFRRVADYVASAEKKYGKSKEEIKKIADEFYGVMAKLYFLPNSPTLMNAGKGNNGILSACVVLPIEDSMESIFTTLKDASLCFKTGAGVGFSFSKIRPAMDIVSTTSGVASGALSFMEVFNTMTEVVKQGGSRRGAMLSCLRVDHPDIEQFIISKSKLDKFNNFNISVSITDKFMDAVSKGTDFALINPRNKKIVKKVDARKLWDLIIEQAWQTGEPGLLYIDTINKHNELPGLGEMEAVNPCFSGDTIIAVADGRNGVPIKELSDKGVEFDIYSARSRRSNFPHIADHKVEIKKAKAFKTGVRDLIKITLSDGSYFKCTPEHPLALSEGGKEIQYVRADNSLGLRLSKFFTFTNLGYGHKYRHINSFTANRQYKMIAEFNDLVGKIHHIDGDSLNDNIGNLMIADEDHLSAHFTQDNPLFKQEYNFRCYVNSKRNVLANYTRYQKTEDWLNKQLLLVDERFKDTINKHKCLQKTTMTTNDFGGDVFVVDISNVGTEDVYDINVEDNHNFYIITKFSDDRYLNCSGVLVHNCGEQNLHPYGNCNLGSIDLSRFIIDGKMDYEKLEYVVRKAVRFLDNVIDVNSYPIPQLKEMAVGSRNIGLGIMGLADMLYKVKLPYNSQEGRDYASDIWHKIHSIAREETKKIAIEKGSFPYIDKSVYKEPYRNARLTTIAPTGTLSMIADTSSGCEPVFALAYTKNVLDGNNFVYVNNELKKILTEQGIYTQDIENKIIKMGSIKDIKEIPSDIKKIFVVANDITPEDHVKMQSELQKYTDAAVSKTVNLPNSATKQEVKSVYELAYKMGCKGVTVYRDGCRQNQVLTVGVEKDSKKEESINEVITRGAVPERPECIECEIHNITVKGTPYVVLAGIKNGQLYEVFVDYALKSDGELRIPKNIEKGLICKVKRGRFDLQIQHEDGLQTTLIENIAGTFDSTAGTLTRMVSLALQSGATLERIVEQLSKSKDMVNFSKALMRVIKQFIKDGEIVTVGDTKCPECGSNLRYESGCVSCSNKDCGWSKCS